MASSSPRRRALLREWGFAFRWVRSGADETIGAGVAPAAACAELARRKALRVAERLRPARGVVLGADTIVAARGRLLGKAAGPAEARRFLRRLSGTTHEVWTGVCFVSIPTMRIRRAAVRTLVTMRRWLPAEVAAYVRSGEWRGKAGAYAIQESADRFVTRVRGSWTNVVGLPMERVAAELRKLGIRGAVSAPGRPARGRTTDRDPGAGAGATRGSRRR